MPFPKRKAALESQHFPALLAFACLALAVALPTLVLYWLCTASVDTWLANLGIKSASTSDVATLRLTQWQTGLAVVLGMVPVSCMAYGLLQARLCFLRFAKGESFTPGVVSHLGRFALCIFVAAVAGMVVPPVVGWLLTLHAPEGQHALGINISSHELLMLLFAGLVWQIAKAMAKAVELAEEHAQIV